MKNNKLNFTIKSLAVFLTVLMFVYAVPSVVFATAAEAIGDFLSSEETQSSVTATEPSQEKERIYEEIDLREENVKHFRLDDGSYVAAQYAVPVHTLDSNGQWQDIDNTLSDDGSDYSTSNARIKFAKKTTGNGTLFTLHDGNYKITLSLDGANKKVEGQITNNSDDADATELQKMMSLEKLSATILYADILDGVDLEYVVASLNVKENIIVKEKQDSYTYSFTLKLNNLSAELMDDGSINIFDPDTLATVYTIPAPTVFDAQGVHAESDKADYTLTDNGNSKYTLTVSVDSAWMNSSERAFPVTVDPAVYVNLYDDMSDTFISSASTTSSFGGYTYMDSGHGASGQEYITYWMPDILPSIPENAYITSAELALHLKSYNTSASVSELILGVYPATSSWTSSHTWTKFTNGTNGSIGELDEWVRVTVDDAGKYISFNITDIALQWLDGTLTNRGVAIRQIGTGRAYARFDATNKKSDMPCFTVNYRTQDGLESYWTYLTQSVDGAGTGYVNVATGNIVFAIDTLATTDGLFGFSPSLVYNSTKMGEYNTSTNNSNSPYKYSSAGLGWRLSVNETVVVRSYTNAAGELQSYYIWTDSDGTEHAFYPKNDGSGEYQDEDGLLMTLRIGTGEILIEDSAHNVRHFKSYVQNSNIEDGAILQKITDKFGNALNFTHDTYGRVTAIGVAPNGSTLIPYLTLTYNSSNCISQIKNLATNHLMTFEYSTTATGNSISSSNGGYLRRVTYSYNGSSTLWIAEYSYNSSGALIRAQNTTSKLGIHYNVNTTLNKPTSIYELGNGTNGQRISLAYGTDYTRVRSSGEDDTISTSDDIFTYYVFDRNGRTVSSYSTNTSGNEIYGASMGAYSDEVTNRVKATAVSGGSAVNYIVNSKFELSKGSVFYWVASSNFSSAPCTATETLAAQVNAKSSTIDNLTQYVSLKNGTYTLSMNLFTRNCKNVDITVSATSLSDSTHAYTKEIPVSEVSVDGKLTPNLTFAVNNSAGYENFMIRIEVTGGASVPSDATVQIDNVMLGKSVGSSAASAINLGAFESSSINDLGATNMTLANAWTVNGSGVELGVASGIDGNGVKITGTAATEKSVSQTVKILSESMWQSGDVPTSQSPANFYILSGFAKSTHQASGGFFGFKAKVTYLDGNEELLEFPCANGIVDTQFVSGLIVIPKGRFVREITVECVYNNLGVAYFDNVSLVPLTEGNAADYKYTEEGYIKAAITTKGSTYYEYNENGDVILEATDESQITKYTYYTNNKALKEVRTGWVEYPDYFEFAELYADGASNDTTAIFANNTINLVTEYYYNAYGLVTSTNTYSPSYSTKKITTASTYNVTAGSKLFGKQLSYIDENGNTTSYSYLTNGNLKYQLSPNGTGLYYTYDSFGRLTEVVPTVYSSSGNSYSGATGEEDVTYLYNTLNQLSGITTATTAYSFTYDNFGNTTSIKAGDNTLATYTYNSNNGKLASMKYGNDTIPLTYQYDALDRLEKVCYNGSVRYEYQYTSDGKLHCVNDYQSDVGYLYSYDHDGRLSEYTEYDLDDMTNTLAISYTYNSRGQIEHILSSIDYVSSGGSAQTLTFSENYAYDELDDMTHLLQNYSLSANGLDVLGIGFEYDSVQRLTKKTVAVNGTIDYENKITYTYADRYAGTLLSYRVATYTTQIDDNAAKTYTYTYDANGNITKIVEEIDGSDDKITQYAYDNLGQLIREDNPYKNTSYVYAYDNNGNRTSVATYSYTTGELGTVGWIGIYTYGDDSWGDLLTMYNGATITYDEIGNPLTYRNNSYYTFTWDGRRLTSATKTTMGSTSYSFTYNDEGIRTSKTAGSTTHYYTLDGSRIVSEEWGNYFAVYLYDESGAPIGMQIRQSSMADGVFHTYYFEKNLQGDIIGVYNSSGNLVYSYVYDAWGNFTATKHISSDTFATYNPFRYRGYYYDTDFGFYYLNSRYYDPITGRFLNADGEFSRVGGEILGNNLFAYCFNNPTNMADPFGNWPKWLDEWVIEKIIVPITIFVARISADIANFDEENTDAETVFNSNYFSSYNGKLVIKTSFDTSFSFGFIALSRQQQDENMLNHEYGHTLQMDNMGIKNYITDVAIPSITINVLSRQGKLPYDYYSYPWEAEANRLGGSTLSTKGKPSLPQDGYTSYWDLIQLFFE